MNQSNAPADESPSPSVIRRVEELCDEFESALKAGLSPDPQDYLVWVAVADRPNLRIELDGLVQAYHPKSDAHQPSPASETLDATLPSRPEKNDQACLPLQFGKYRILGRLGEGAMGVVYRAHHPVLNKDVALKTIRPQNLLRWGETARILAEARNVAKLKHPHIVAIHDADEENGWPYFTMALVEGGTLYSHLNGFEFGGRPKNEMGQPGELTLLGWSRKQRKARREKILTLMEKVCRAVHAAHANVPTIIHRDLKPGNILLDGDEPRVSDFGLAKSVSTDGGEQISEEGTPPYMSPEQHRGEAKQIRAPSDVWSIGVILYELFTGRRPFLGTTHSEIKSNVLNAQPPRPGELNEHIDLDLEAVILKSLEKDVSQRYQTAQELGDDLLRCRSDMPIPIRPIGKSERLWRWSQRNPALASLSVLAALVMVGTIAFYLSVIRDETHRKRAERIKAATEFQKRGIDLCERGEAGQGILWLARSLETAPGDATTLQGLIRGKMTEYYSKIMPLREIIEEPGRVLAIASSHDGQLLLTGDDDGHARLYDTKKCEMIAKWRHPERVFAVALTRDGAKALTGCFDGRARFWNVSSGELAFPPLGDQKLPVFAVGISPDGSTLFSGCGDGTVRLWDAMTGMKKHELNSGNEIVVSLAVSSDGNTLVTGTTDANDAKSGKARLWNVATGAPHGTPLPHIGPVLAVAFGPDDQTIVTGGDTHALHWDLVTGKPRRARYAHGVPVKSVAISGDGKTILTGGKDRTARLWEEATGKLLYAPLRHAGEVRSVAFCPGTAMRVLTGGEDGSIKVWNTPSFLRDPVDFSVLYAQVLTGMELDEHGTIHALNSQDWHERKTRWEKLAPQPIP